MSQIELMALELLVINCAEKDVGFPNLWTVPGGHLEHRGTVKEAVEKEMHEETGLEVKGVLGEFDELRWIHEDGNRKT